jgi:CheY-like chemotaxis protein
VRILLVDPDGDRAAALGEALAAAGARVTLAASGSFALTMLEWNRHDIIVSRARLGDMEGRELCTILRDDPGMKELRFVLVASPDEVSPDTGSAGIDLLLPSTMSAPTMLARMTRLIPDVTSPPMEAPRPPPVERSDPEQAIDAAPIEPAAVDTLASAAREAEGASQGFAGSLDGIELGELARAIAGAGRTGHLLVALATAGGAVAFEGGRVVHAEFRDETGGPAFAALIGAAHRERVGEFCFVADDSGGLRGTPRTVQKSIEELLRGS